MTIEELELKLKSIEKTVLKYGRYIEEIEKDVAIVKTVLVRLEKIENKEK